MNSMFSEQIEPWLEYEQTRVWGSTDWRRNMLFTEEVHKVLDMNMDHLRALHKQYGCRKDRLSTWARHGEFILEDAVKMMQDAQSTISEHLIQSVYGVSKHTIVINDNDEAG
jgi:hypothetical protein